MKEKLRQIGEHHLIYNLNKWTNNGEIDILNDNSEKVTLVQFMETMLNVNHAISIVGYCIFNSKYEN